MIRTTLLSIALLATAGAANASEIKVSLSGKTETAVRNEVFSAARTACIDVSVSDYASCVTETYLNAMQDVKKIKATKVAALTF